jgi:hypothetical protein
MKSRHQIGVHLKIPLFARIKPSINMYKNYYSKNKIFLLFPFLFIAITILVSGKPIMGAINDQSFWIGNMFSIIAALLLLPLLSTLYHKIYFHLKKSAS